MTNQAKRRSETATVSSSSTNHTVVMKLSTLIEIGVVLLLIVISFYGGILYDHGQRTYSPNSADSLDKNFAIGLVVYTGSTSLTISNENDTYNQTFSVSSKTLISINDHKASLNQVMAGDIVLIRTAKDDVSKANVILVNSHFKG